MFNKNNQIKLKNTQNFLQSKKLVSELIEESNICEDDIVIEIGGGKGIITEQLVKRCRRLYVIEYDYDLYKKLKNKFYNIRNIEIIHGDFLGFELPVEYKYKVFSSTLHPHRNHTDCCNRAVMVSHVNPLIFNLWTLYHDDSHFSMLN